MKSKILFSIILMLCTLLYIPFSFSATLADAVLKNDVWDGHAIYEVDVILTSLDVAPLQLAQFTIGLTWPIASENGGTITASWVAGTSELTNPTQLGTSLLTNTTTGTTRRLFRATGPVPPGAGNGSVISMTGTRFARLRLTNSVDWVITSSNDIQWSTAAQYPKSLNMYINNLNTNITTSTTFRLNLTSLLLPVELSSFVSNVSGRNINLSWETKTEVNTRQFEIDRALLNTKDASITWSSIGNVQASGTSTTTMKYSFTEKNLQSGKYQYRIKMIDNDGSYKLSDVVESEIALPKNFELSQNYPNPFNPSTRINYSLPFDSRVTLEVYNIAGERMGQIVNQEQSAGYYTVNFSSSALNRNIASGIYIYKINAIDNSTGNEFTSIKKMMLLK